MNGLLYFRTQGKKVFKKRGNAQMLFKGQNK